MVLATLGIDTHCHNMFLGRRDLVGVRARDASI